MIDTAILLVGLMCVALTCGICTLVYGNFSALGKVGYKLRAALPSTANVHNLVLAMATVCAFAAIVISSQSGEMILVVDQSVAVTLASK